MLAIPENKDTHELNIIERNIQALLDRKKNEKKKRSRTEKLVDGITNFASSLLSVIIHILIFGVWILWNTGMMDLKPFDPQFIFLATFAAVEAIFLTTFVLIGQKQINVQADKWAELDLQISLLTEHEVTRVLKLITQVAQKLNVEIPHEEIKELSKDVHPDKVLDAMEKASE